MSDEPALLAVAMAGAEDHLPSAPASARSAIVGTRATASAVSRSRAEVLPAAFTITAYANRRRGRVVSTARTKTGTVPQVGRTVAVDPRIIPLGSIVHIDGIGERIAEDTGGKVKGRHIDLFVGSHEEGVQFGVRRGFRVRIVAASNEDRMSRFD